MMFMWFFFFFLPLFSTGDLILILRVQSELQPVDGWQGGRGEAGVTHLEMSASGGGKTVSLRTTSQAGSLE